MYFLCRSQNKVCYYFITLSEYFMYTHVPMLEGYSKPSNFNIRTLHLTCASQLYILHVPPNQLSVSDIPYDASPTPTFFMHVHIFVLNVFSVCSRNKIRYYLINLSEYFLYL